MIFNMTGGGAGGAGGGATLVVSCPANVTVTVSKDDKSYTKNSGNLGSATFKGLATGEWTVTIEGNEQTATKTITITADYAITIAFFAAYINITYPANSTCVVQTSGGTTVASDSNSTSSEKTFTATVNATGTYTVTATATDGSGKSKSTTVSITTEGQSESVTLSYELYIFKSGSGLTAGYTFENIASSSSSSDSLIANTNDEYVNNGSFYITPKTKFDGYSNLKFDLVGFKYTGQYSPNPNVRYGCSSNTTVTEGSAAPSASNYTASSNSLPTTRTTVSVDVSSISTEQYVKVETLDARLVIYNIWLE